MTTKTTTRVVLGETRTFTTEDLGLYSSVRVTKHHAKRVKQDERFYFVPDDNGSWTVITATCEFHAGACPATVVRGVLGAALPEDIEALLDRLQASPDHQE